MLFVVLVSRTCFPTNFIWSTVGQSFDGNMNFSHVVLRERENNFYIFQICY